MIIIAPPLTSHQCVGWVWGGNGGCNFTLDAAVYVQDKAA